MKRNSTNSFAPARSWLPCPPGVTLDWRPSWFRDGGAPTKLSAKQRKTIFHHEIPGLVRLYDATGKTIHPIIGPPIKGKKIHKASGTPVRDPRFDREPENQAP